MRSGTVWATCSSRSVIPYDLQRVGDDAVLHRSPNPPSGPTLYNRFKNQSDWKFPLAPKRDARVVSCDLLSGESLIDKISFRDALAARFPTAQGGEMEGAGFYAAAQMAGVQWLIVKAICDFADGKKSIGKKKKQATAAESAASLCHHVFSSPTALRALGCKIVAKSAQSASAKSPELPDPVLVSRTLFNVYQPEFEQFYVTRKFDSELCTTITTRGAWVSGPTGCGKTNAIVRSFYRSNKPFHVVDLSMAIGSGIPAIFQVLHAELAQQFGVALPAARKRCSLNELISSIANLLREQVHGETLILIDEIPADGRDFKAFVQASAAIVIRLATALKPVPARFVFSSIPDPRPHIGGIQAKFEQLVALRPQGTWTDAELMRLLKLISRKLQVPFTAIEAQQIILGCTSSPRLLKSIVQTHITFIGSAGWSVTRAVQEATGGIV